MQKYLFVFLLQALAKVVLSKKLVWIDRKCYICISIYIYILVWTHAYKCMELGVTELGRAKLWHRGFPVKFLQMYVTANMRKLCMCASQGGGILRRWNSQWDGNLRGWNLQEWNFQGDGIHLLVTLTRWDSLAGDSNMEMYIYIYTYLFIGSTCRQGGLSSFDMVICVPSDTVMNV